MSAYWFYSDLRQLYTLAQVYMDAGWEIEVWKWVRILVYMVAADTAPFLVLICPPSHPHHCPILPILLSSYPLH